MHERLGLSVAPLEEFLGHCGSCWAFGAVESLSDPFCIHYGLNISLSVNDLLACCGFLFGEGCDGGYPISAWRYFIRRGVVTEECDPTLITRDVPMVVNQDIPPPSVKGSVTRRTFYGGNQSIMVSMHTGSAMIPTVSCQKYTKMDQLRSLLEDFAHYKSGVHKHVTGHSMGGHAVKLIGWETSEEGEDYWDGYSKIRRGTNECGIEHTVVAGLPSARNLNVGLDV